MTDGLEPDPNGVAGFTLRGAFRELGAALLPPRAGKIAARFRRVRGRLWLFAIAVAISLVYLFFMSAGGLAHWPIYGTYIDLMADGFRRGQLHMPIDPAPELLRAQDPYAWTYSRYWALDASYYAGKYYGYWGPVPALIQAAAKSVLGVHGIVGDHYVSLFHLCIGAWAGIGVIERMTLWLFAAISRRLLAICCFAFAFAYPTLHGATTAGTYHAAILAAQAWLLVGLVPAIEAIFLADVERTQRLRLVLAGTAWSLALGSRVALMPCIAALLAITAAAEACSFERRFRRAFLSALWLGAPVAIVGAALLVYNKVRFDDWLEFGINLQLSAFPYRVSKEFVLTNVYAYTLRPFVTSCEFPYVFQVWRMGASAFPEHFQLPRGYSVNEPTIGWLRAAPLTWLIPFAILCVPRPFNLRAREHRTYVWCLASFGALATISGFGTLGGYGSTMRYLSDVINGLLLLSLLAAFALKAHRLGKIAPRATSGVIALLALATVVFGLLIGYQGYNGHFARYNPALHAKLSELFSVCGGKPHEMPAFAP